MGMVGVWGTKSRIRTRANLDQIQIDIFHLNLYMHFTLFFFSPLIFVFKYLIAFALFILQPSDALNSHFYMDDV